MVPQMKILFDNESYTALTFTALPLFFACTHLLNMLPDGGSWFSWLFLSVLLMVAAGFYSVFCRRRLTRYDPVRSMVQRVVWRHTGWQVLEERPLSDFDGVALTDDGADGDPRYAQMILVGGLGHSDWEIDQENQGKQDANVRARQKKIAALMRLPPMAYPLSRQNARAAAALDGAFAERKGKAAAAEGFARDDFQAAAPPKVSAWELACNFAGTALAAFLLLWIIVAMMQHEPDFWHVFGAQAVLLLGYGVLSGTLAGTRLMRQRTAYLDYQGNPAAAAGEVRRTIVIRRSAAFSLFQPWWWQLWFLLTLGFTAMLLYAVVAPLIKNFADIGKELSKATPAIAFGILPLSWLSSHLAFKSNRTRKLAYDAPSDTITLYCLDALLRWRHEQSFAADRVIGIAAMPQKSDFGSKKLGLALIVEGQDELLFLAEARPEKAAALAQSIREVTGLPLVEARNRAG